jgi:hypothetical protein
MGDCGKVYNPVAAMEEKQFNAVNIQQPADLGVVQNLQDRVTRVDRSREFRDKTNYERLIVSRV